MKKILIVEDELAYSIIMHGQLIANGYEVIEAGDGEAGFELAKKEKPELILLDLRMPKMDGMTLLSLIRKDEVLKNTKVIILTVLEIDKETLSHIIDTGLTSYCVKSDTTLEALLNKIKEMTS